MHATYILPALELHSRAAPSVEAHYCSVGPDTGKNSGGKQKKGDYQTITNHSPVIRS